MNEKMATEEYLDKMNPLEKRSRKIETQEKKDLYQRYFKNVM